MSMCCKFITPSRLPLAVSVVLFAILTVGLPAEAKSVYWGRSKQIVVLDPGHGGVDIGARSPDGILEKQAAFDLSQRLAAQMTDRYRVTLTRSDDYQLDIDGRTDIANNLGADLFLSIHAAGSFATAARGIYIYYFKDPSVSDLPIGPGMSDNDQEPLLAWDHLQLRHVRISRLLAQSLKERLSPLNQVTVLAAPILVLRGADMPAVLIEIGHLSHIEDAKMLRDPTYLESLVVAITNGIEDFF